MPFEPQGCNSPEYGLQHIFTASSLRVFTSRPTRSKIEASWQFITPGFYTPGPEKGLSSFDKPMRKKYAETIWRCTSESALGKEITALHPNGFEALEIQCLNNSEFIRLSWSKQNVRKLSRAMRNRKTPEFSKSRWDKSFWEAGKTRELWVPLEWCEAQNA